MNICLKVVMNFGQPFPKPTPASSLENQCEFGCEPVYSGRYDVTFTRSLRLQTFTLMSEAEVYSETSVHTYQTTRRHISEYSNFHSHCCRNLDSVINTLSHISYSLLFAILLNTKHYIYTNTREGKSKLHVNNSFHRQPLSLVRF
jgi:hypothetical protein